MRRVLFVLVALLTVVVVGASVVSVVTVRRSFPQTTGERQLDGLSGTVDIRRDAQGVPQIYADTPEDLFLAQGYVHAQDRFWEMDFRRHVTGGRLAELVGEGALDTDKFVRTLGWRRVAEQEYAELDESTRQLLVAYSRGVNDYIAGRTGSRLSLEYSILSLTGPDYRPEPWTPVDSIAWIKAMAWDLRSNMNDEIARAVTAKQMPREQVEELYPDPPTTNLPIVDDAAFELDGETFGPVDTASDVAPVARSFPGESLTAAQRAADELPALLGTGDGIGSNSWVVSGDRTATGRPILANDPHLAPSMPGIWYQVGLHCRTVDEACPYDVSGFTFSGLPGVVVGHNARIAWGVTTMYADVADLYVEKVTGDTYEFRGEQVPLETRTETFEVAGGDTEQITVRSTRHGPILSDLDDDIASVGASREVALQWTALTPRPTIKAVFALGRAQDWDDFRAAAELFTVPSQNLVYADVDGNIGYQSPGAIPVRPEGDDGRWPVEGWTGEHEWSGYLPFDSLPTVLNPESGVIVTANNTVIGDDYPQLLGADTAHGYRSQRIRDVLAETPELDVDDMTALQLDGRHPMASVLDPYLQTPQLVTDYYRDGQRLLRGWDGQMDEDSAAAAYFAAVWRNLLALTFEDELPALVRPDGNERWYTVMTGLLKDPDSHWWNDQDTIGVVEDRDMIVVRAMQAARDDLTRAISRNPDEWSWGELHQLTLVNPTLGDSGIGVVEGLFNRGPYRVGGGGGQVNATGWDAAEGYEVTAVPSMRMVVDLADLDRSRWIQLTGQSGHAFHPHYVDQQDLWRAGDTLPWAFSDDAVRTSTEDTLTLRPGG